MWLPHGSTAQTLSATSNPLQIQSGQPNVESQPVSLTVRKVGDQQPVSGTATLSVTTPASGKNQVPAGKEPSLPGPQVAEKATIQPALNPPKQALAQQESPPPKSEVVPRPDSAASVPQKSTGPRFFSLFIAVSEYQHAGWDLPNLERPVHDARAFHQLLTTRYQFDPALSKLLVNPTRAQIIDHLEKLAEVVTENDNLLFFYAGHGFFDKGKKLGFWLPANASMASRSEWLPNSQIKDYLGAINSKHTLLLADACFSGSIFKTRTVTDNSVKQASDSYKLRSRRAITSGNLSEVPDQSVFLEALLKALQKNDKQFATGQQIFVRVYDEVTNNSHTIPQYGIIQGTGDEGGDFLFIRR